MSYPIPWRFPKDGFFDPNEFSAVAQDPFSRIPFKCTEHPNCFAALMDSAAPGAGWWDLNTPINIPTQMPGTGQKLTGFHYECMHQYGFGCGPSDVGTSVILIKNGGTFYDQRVNCPKDAWFLGDVNLTEDLTTNLQLNVSLFQITGAITCLSWAKVHFRNFYLTGVYYSEIPPPTATVEIDVTDLDTGMGISEAEVRLLSEVYNYGPAYTDGGMATLTNVNYGTYTLKISKSQYKTLSTPISVNTPLVHPSAPYALEFIGGDGLPWWWWIIPVGVGGVILTWALARTFAPKKRELPPVFVVK